MSCIYYKLLKAVCMGVQKPVQGCLYGYPEASPRLFEWVSRSQSKAVCMGIQKPVQGRLYGRPEASPRLFVWASRSQSKAVCMGVQKPVQGCLAKSVCDCFIAFALYTFYLKSSKLTSTKI